MRPLILIVICIVILAVVGAVIASYGLVQVDFGQAAPRFPALCELVAKGARVQFTDASTVTLSFGGSPVVTGVEWSDVTACKNWNK